MFIPLSVPNLKGFEKDYVLDAVNSEWISTSGSYVDLFEKDMASYLNVNNTVACQSGTAALHLALKLCGVSKDCEVIVPTLTFIASVNPIKYLNAQPIFMDCDNTLNMDLDKLENFLSKECALTFKGLVNKKTKNYIKAIVVVHVFGNMIDMERLISLSEKYNLKVVEDACEAVGSYVLNGKYKNKFAGTIGDFGVFSFNGNKIITTGGGGMIYCNDDTLLQKAKYLSTQAKDDTLNYIHNEVGYNYRMTNLQAAVGVAQLKSLEEFISIKEQNYYIYKEYLDNIKGLQLLDFNSHSRNNYWFYSLIVNPNEYGLTNIELMQKLTTENIETRPIWSLIHTQIPYKNNQNYKIEKAVSYQNQVLNLPCSTNLTKEQIIYVILTIQKLGVT